MSALLDTLNTFVHTPFGALIWLVVRIMLIIVPVLLGVAYLILRRAQGAGGDCKLRMGPNVVGPSGCLQPIADAIKLRGKETIFHRRETS